MEPCLCVRWCALRREIRQRTPIYPARQQERGYHIGSSGVRERCGWSKMHEKDRSTRRHGPIFRPNNIGNTRAPANVVEFKI